MQIKSLQDKCQLRVHKFILDEITLFAILRDDEMKASNFQELQGIV